MWTGEPRDYWWCGLRVRSVVPLPWPAAGLVGGEPAITIAAGEVSGPSVPAGASTLVTVDADGLVLGVEGLGRFRASAGREIRIDAPATARLEDIRLYLCGSVFGAIWLQRGTLPLHASAVVRDGSCIAFAGSSGAGKSTLVAHLAQSGWTLWSDDVCVIDLMNGGVPGVWAGVARVKLARDALAWLEQDASTLPHAGGTRDKYHLEVAGAGSDGTVPLRGFYLLTRGPAVRVERLTGLAAIDAVAGHTYCEDFVRPLGCEARWLSQVVRVARSVPVSRLVRPLGFGHMAEVLETLATDVARGV